MSLQKTLKIKGFISKFLHENGEIRKKDIMNVFPGSNPLIGYVLGRLVQKGEILKVGSTRGAYYITNTAENRKSLETKVTSVRKTYKNVNLEEDIIFEEVCKALPRLKILHENIKSILFYAFTEMVNNAIDHSNSDRIDVFVDIVQGKLHFEVRDYGIGVFNNVRKKKKLSDNYDAAAELLKGKTTTAPDIHSGEGIFFTSKAADIFILESYGFVMKIDNVISDVFVHENAELKGTKVVFEIALNSGRHLGRDVFGPYTTSQDEPAFDKTKIRVSLYKHGTAQMSRSQARRIISGLEKFKTVIFDFDKIPYVGQAFTDEIFRVFARRNPHIRLLAENANKSVEFMIERVKASS